LVQDKPFTVHGSGEQGRDFLYIGDVVELLMQTLHYRPQGVEVVNLCSGKMVTVNSIIKLLSEISGKQVAVDYQGALAEDMVTWWGDNTACREKFNWIPRVTMEEGLTLTYQWFERGSR
jgi:UDP-glucose 4-epimerase